MTIALDELNMVLSAYERQLLSSPSKWCAKGKKKRRSARSYFGDNFEFGKCCVFCGALAGTFDANGVNVEYGEFYAYTNGFAAHELCMWFASGMRNSDHDESALTARLFFSIKDIHREFRCGVCKKSGATIGCAVRTCVKQFHLNCARRARCLFNFNSYTVYCIRDRDFAKQQIYRTIVDSDRLQPTNAGDVCICFEPVAHDMILQEVIKIVCCRIAFAHFDCIQNLANSRGIETQCPLCNQDEAVTEYRKQIASQGIHIPHKVASYDDIDNGRQCIADECTCPFGRNYCRESTPNENEPWEWLNECDTCISFIHRKCAGAPWCNYDPFDDNWNEPRWACSGCRSSTDVIVIDSSSAVKRPRSMIDSSIEWIPSFVKSRFNYSLINCSENNPTTCERRIDTRPSPLQIDISDSSSDDVKLLPPKRDNEPPTKLRKPNSVLTITSTIVDAARRKIKTRDFAFNMLATSTPIRNRDH